MEKIYLYLHGLNSDVNCRSQKDLNNILHNVQGLGYDYSKNATYCFNQLCSQLEEHIKIAESMNQEVKLLGSSLGGFWTLILAKKYSLPSLVFNPVTYPHEQLKPIIGKNQNFYTLKEYDLTEEIVNSFSKYELNPNIEPKPYLILGEQDELLPFSVALNFWKNNAYCILTDELHSISDYSKYLSLLKIF